MEGTGRGQWKVGVLQEYGEVWQVCLSVKSQARCAEAPSMNPSRSFPPQQTPHSTKLLHMKSNCQRTTTPSAILMQLAKSSEAAFLLML